MKKNHNIPDLIIVNGYTYVKNGVFKCLANFIKSLGFQGSGCKG